MIVVTHEMDFARDVAERVIFMEHGVIVEEGTPQQIFRNPRQPRTRNFVARIAGGHHDTEAPVRSAADEP
jgi:ABC-type polar amino acid transport system ATPase subunit